MERLIKEFITDVRDKVISSFLCIHRFKSQFTKKKKKKESVHCVKLQIHLTGRCSLLLVPMRPGNLQDVELEPEVVGREKVGDLFFWFSPIIICLCHKHIYIYICVCVYPWPSLVAQW